VICVARVSAGAAEALAGVTSVGASPQAVSAAIEAREASERNKSLLRNMIILLFCWPRHRRHGKPAPQWLQPRLPEHRPVNVAVCYRRRGSGIHYLFDFYWRRARKHVANFSEQKNARQKNKDRVWRFFIFPSRKKHPRNRSEKRKYYSWMKFSTELTSG
jgi:hypothetical protein